MRRTLDRVVSLAAGLCAVFAIGLLAWIAGSIAMRGMGAMSWSFFTQQIQLAGAAGGIFHNLVGTLILAGTAFLVTVPLSTGIALVHGVYWRHSPMRRRLWLMLSTLNGVPSILFGLFGFIVFTRYLGWGKSWLAGGILLGVMIVPIVSVALIERIEAIPQKYIAAAAGLGLNQSQIIGTVILPQGAQGLVTGVLLGLGRAAGETAPIMFTATIFSGAAFPTGIRDNPVLTLPYHIFILSQDSLNPQARINLWGAALVLLGISLAFSLAAVPARLRIHEEARRA